MDTIVIKIWRALTRSPENRGTPPGARVLPAYAALARYRSSADLDPQLRMLVSQLAAERSSCRWCIDRGRHRWREAQLSLEALCALPRYETSSPWRAPVGSAIRNL